MPRLFISYSSADRGFVEQLARDLRENGVEPWFDAWEILPGDSLTRKIGEAILSNEMFVVVLSPQSVASEWVQQELAVALDREFKERQVTVIPVLYQLCPIPPFLRDKRYADFTQDYRVGLRDLLAGVLGRPSTPLATSVPASAPEHVIWTNVESSTGTAEHIHYGNVETER